MQGDTCGAIVKHRIPKKGAGIRRAENQTRPIVIAYGIIAKAIIVATRQANTQIVVCHDIVVHVATIDIREENSEAVKAPSFKAVLNTKSTYIDI